MNPPRAVQNAAEWIAQFSGTLTFLALNGSLWAFWFVTGGVGRDPFPFQFLTLLLSLEAIVLTTLVLFNQLRNEKRDKEQADIDRQRNQHDLDVDVKSLALLEELIIRTPPKTITRKVKP